MGSATSSSRRAATSPSTIRSPRSRRCGSERPITSSNSVMDRSGSAAKSSASSRRPCVRNASTSSSAFEPKWAYRAPLLTPAAAAISATLVPSYPRSANTAAAARSNRSRVSAALTPAVRPMAELNKRSSHSSTGPWVPAEITSQWRLSQRQAEVPVRVRPEPGRLQSGRGKFGLNAVAPELGGNFCPHLFPGSERNGHPEIADRYQLLAVCRQAHFDPFIRRVPDGEMPELLDGEVGVQIAVDDFEDVAVELRRDAGRVVVGAEQAADVFDQVRPQEEGVARTQGGSDLTKE